MHPFGALSALAALLVASAPAEATCLAEAVYYEARNEPINGQIAVAQVVLNRRQSPKHPQTLCAVVYQRKGKTCQFSWACNPRLLAKPKDSLQWAIAEQVAAFALKGLPDRVRGATYFHATYVRPNLRHLQRTVRIGRHIFYRERNTKR
jgi:spore germination cell wall hydrolase CwlJ-like protein